MMEEEINKGDEIVTCPTCGAAAKTLPCRKGFVPSLKCIDSVDGGAWKEVNKIIEDAKRIYEGYPTELDAINYVYQRLEAAKR